MTDAEIAELITRRRRQILVHSVIYYRLNENLVSDAQWQALAVELDRLQQDYPDIAETCPYAEAFREFDNSTGFNLPLTDPWAVNKARQLVMLKNQKADI